MSIAELVRLKVPTTVRQMNLVRNVEQNGYLVRQSRAREKLSELLSINPIEWRASENRALGKSQYYSLLVHRIGIATQMHEFPIYIATIQELSQPRPTFIALLGHSLVASEWIHGYQEGDLGWENLRKYNFGYLQELLDLGYNVVAFDQFGLGKRQIDRGQNAVSRSCTAVNHVLLEYGETLLGHRVMNIAAVLSYLRNCRSDLCGAKPFGVIGLSGGGTAALHAGAMLPELVDVTVASGAIGEVGQYLLGWEDNDGMPRLKQDRPPHCTCNYVPGFAKYFDIADLGALIAPRPLLVEHGKQDEIFPINGARKCAEEIGKVYEALGEGSKFRFFEHDGPHRFDGTEIYPAISEFMPLPE